MPVEHNSMRITMFTIFAGAIAIGAIAFSLQTISKNTERVSAIGDEELRRSVLHSIQGIKLITVMLGAILIMLGIIADRLP
jgi:hypothetical protein